MAGVDGAGAGARTFGAAGATGGSGAERRGVRSGQGGPLAEAGVEPGGDASPGSTQARDRRGTGTVAGSSATSSSWLVRSGSTKTRDGRRGGAGGSSGLGVGVGCRGAGPGATGVRPGSGRTAGCSWASSAALFGSSGSAGGSARRGRGGGSSASESGSGSGLGSDGAGSAGCGSGAGTNPLDRRGTYATAGSVSPGSVSNARRGRVTAPVFQARPVSTQGCVALDPERTRSGPAKGFPGGPRCPTVDMSAPSVTQERNPLSCRPCTAPATTG